MLCRAAAAAAVRREGRTAALRAACRGPRARGPLAAPRLCRCRCAAAAAASISPGALTAFQRLDTNGDGQLCRAEVRPCVISAIEADHQYIPEEVRGRLADMLIRRADRNQNGTLDFQEFESFFVGIEARKSGAVWATLDEREVNALTFELAMGLFDYNGDGKLQRSELRDFVNVWYGSDIGLSNIGETTTHQEVQPVKSGVFNAWALVSGVVSPMTTAETRMATGQSGVVSVKVRDMVLDRSVAAVLQWYDANGNRAIDANELRRLLVDPVGEELAQFNDNVVKARQARQTKGNFRWLVAALLAAPSAWAALSILAGVSAGVFFFFR